MKEDFIKENINKDFVNKAKWIVKLGLFYKWVDITEGRNFYYCSAKVSMELQINVAVTKVPQQLR